MLEQWIEKGLSETYRARPYLLREHSIHCLDALERQFKNVRSLLDALPFKDRGFPNHEINSSGQTHAELNASLNMCRAVFDMQCLMLYLEGIARLHKLGGSKNTDIFITWPEHLQPAKNDRATD